LLKIFNFVIVVIHKIFIFKIFFANLLIIILIDKYFIHKK
jgi:hypothetical protein